MTLKKSIISYHFTFYNKNWLHYNVKSHILLYMTNKDLLISSVYFILSLCMKIKRPHGAGRWKPSRLFEVEKGGQIILEIASLWTIVVGNVYGECRALCRFKTRSVNFKKGRHIVAIQNSTFIA